MAQKDIKDFTLLASSEDTDNVLLVRNDDTAAKIPVGTLKSEFASTISSESGTSDSARGVETRIIKDSGTAFAAATNSDSVSTGNGVTLTETIGTITDLLEGDNSVAYARNNAYVNLGGYSSWADANAALDALMLDNTTHKYDGRLKFDVQGVNCEVVMFICAWGTPPIWVQRVSGPLRLVSGALASGSSYAEYSRYTHSGTGVVSDWIAYPDLSSYATSSALSDVLAIANGTSSSDVWDMAVKVITYGDGLNGVIPTINQLMLDGYDYKKHGAYLLRYTNTGCNFFLLQGGLNVNNYPSYSTRSVTQIAIGNVATQNNPDTSATGTTWAEQGFPNGIITGHGSVQILVRRLYFSGNSRVITKWMPLSQYYAEQNDGNLSVNSDVAMRPLYFLGNTQFYSGERKVSYNSRTGYYSLNGLTDITADEMRDIYAYSHVPFAAGACLDKRFRTNLPWSVYDVQKGNAQADSLSVLHLFARNTRLEVVQICSLADYPAKCTNYSYAFLNCSALHTVGKISLTYCTTSSQFYYMFRNCTALANIEISDLKISGFSLAESPNITAASISFLISNAANTSAITVTVNQNVLDSINHGEDDWTGIADAATAQQISFVS